MTHRTTDTAATIAPGADLRPGDLRGRRPDGPRKVAFIHSGAFFHLATLADPAVRALDLVEVYAPDIKADSLSGCDAIFLAARQHPDVLTAIAPFLLDALQTQGTKVYIDGENHVGSWLPGTSEIGRGTNFWAWRTGEDVGRRSVNPDHPMWDYLNDFSVHWHYHAVLAPPPGAVPLVVLTELDRDTTASGTDPWGHDYLAVPEHPNVLLYHDATTFPAQVLVSTMDCAYHHGSGFMPGASALLYRVLSWLRQ